MIKNISKSRQQYNDTYKALRLWGEEWYRFEISNHLNDVEECALLSYDERNSYFSGWIDPVRKTYFYYETSVKYPRLYGLPF